MKNPKSSPNKDIDMSLINVQVPASYIKNKVVRDDWESMQCLGLPLVIESLKLKPVTFGVWTVLELINAENFVCNPAMCTNMDVARALYINEHRDECLADISGFMQEAACDKDSYETDFDEKVAGFIRSYPEVFEPVALDQIFEWFHTSWNGWDMFPQGAGGQDLSWYGAVNIGSVIAGCGDVMSKTPHELLWDVSCCMIGHTIAQVAIKNGSQHVGRPKDPNSIKEEIAKAKQKVVDGELFQWQIDNPDRHHLSEVQIEHGGAKVKLAYEKAKAAYEKSKKESE